MHRDGDEDAALAAALRGLPQLEAPERVWARLQARRRRQRRPGWHGPALAVAATVVMAVALVWMLPGEAPGPVVDGGDRLAGFAAESDQLERLLAGLDPDERVLDMRTAGAIVALEDSIAAVDGQLQRAVLGHDEAEILWRQRVDLMRALVGVHATRTPTEF